MKRVDLGDVCDIIGGGTPSKQVPAYYGGDILWTTVGDMQGDYVSDTQLKITAEGLENSSANIIPKDHVIIATRVGLGKVCLLKKDAAINQDLKGVIPKKGQAISNRFLFWWLKSVGSEIIGAGTGATVQGVRLPFIKQLKYPDLPLPEQERIVAQLDAAFAAIDAAKANVERNLQNAKELFQSKLNEVFSQKGDGWVAKKLKDIIDKTQNIKWSDYPTTSFEYIDLSAVSRDTLLITETATVNISNAPSRAKKIINTEDVIFATTRPTLKRVTIIPSQLNGQLCSTGYAVLRPKKDKVLSELIFYFIQTEIFMERMENLQRGASYPAVTDSDVFGATLSFPTDKDEQRKVVNNLDELQSLYQSLIDNYTQKLRELDDLKKSLLERAFRGEI